MIAGIIQAVLALLAVLLVYSVVRQTRDVMRLLHYLRRESTASVRRPKTALPRTAVILSLRGPDPRLKDTLQALMSQDYPDFQIRVIVDHESDPVLQDVLAVQDGSPPDRIAVSFLKDPSPSCSLKCSSLIQAVTELDADVDVVAFIDGDAVPHGTWLRELVTPVATGEADVAGGNRWYQPPSARIGTLARYFWNVAFLTGMWAQGAPWAGTMAFRRETANRIGLLTAWGSAMSVDATLHRCMRQHGLRFKLVASLIMPNREDISLSDFHRWVARQMTVIRYSVSATVRGARLQMGILLLLHSLLPVTAVLAAAFGLGTLAGTAAGLLGLYWGICSLRVLLMERAVRALFRSRGERVTWLRPATIVLWYPCVAIAHYVVGVGSLLALRLQQVDWRGIRYRLSRNGGVLMHEYRPYRPDWTASSNRSVV